MDTASLREYVHLYAEGCLPDYAEPTLFAELSHNGDLRAELTAQIKLLATVKHYTASIHATPQSKNALFAELGLAMPESATTANVVALQTASRLSANRRGVGVFTSNPRLFAVSASLVSSLLTALVMVLLNGTSDGEIGEKEFFPAATYLRVSPVRSEERIFSTSRQSLSHQSLIPRSPFFKGANEETVENVVQKGEQNLAQAVAPQAPSPLANTVPETSANTFVNASANVFAPEVASPARAWTEEPQTPVAIRPVAKTLTRELYTTEESLPVRLAVRHSLGGTELGLHGSISYALSKQHTIGFEGGSEGAQLLLRKAQSGGEVVRLGAGTTSVFSGTAFYRYSFTQLALTPTQALVPFVQAGFGVMGRCGALQGMAGLRFDVVPELSFLLAADAKLPVLYAEQHFQSKTGFSIGMQYHISDK